jgi:hypothetical protein
LGIGDWAQSPIPNPQSPIPNPQSPFFIIIYNIQKLNNQKNYKKLTTKILKLKKNIMK